MREEAPAGDVVIGALGAGGDGVADRDGTKVFVPFGLPGEAWRRTGGSWQRISTAPERVEPPCPRFGRCGGCVAQHLSDDLYVRWKTGILETALRHQKIDAPIEQMMRVPERARRRAVFGATRRGGATAFGFHVRASHEIVDVAACVILSPLIVERLPELEALAAVALRDGQSCRVAVTATPAGLDVELAGEKKMPPERKTLLAGMAGRVGGLARLTVDGETVLQTAEPALLIDGIKVVPPPGTFIQAVADAEIRLIGLVRDGLGPARRVADLFSGIGTFALPIARTARVLAVDAAGEAIGALEAARLRATGLKPIETKVRDLLREPLSARELKGFDAVVVDPPRAGAGRQAEMIAKSEVPRVVMVSCNPATLARDLRVLIDGGFRIERVAPVDQFLYSAELEAVAVLSRSPARKRR